MATPAAVSSKSFDPATVNLRDTSAVRVPSKAHSAVLEINDGPMDQYIYKGTAVLAHPLAHEICSNAKHAFTAWTTETIFLSENGTRIGVNRLVRTCYLCGEEETA
jgi:hypothetical protein